MVETGSKYALILFPMYSLELVRPESQGKKQINLKNTFIKKI
jgi:hypothetical protein